MPPTDLTSLLNQLFDAERAARAAHGQLVDAPPQDLLVALEAALVAARGEAEEDERALRLVRISALLGELEGSRAVDLLIDVLGSEEPEARHAAGGALEDLAYDRFKEVAVGVERALERLPSGHLALAELPYLLADVPEPGVLRLLGRFLQHKDPEAVAAAIEAVVEFGDPSASAMLAPLERDPRLVQMEDEDGDEGKVTLGELATEARQILGPVERAPSGEVTGRGKKKS